LIKELGIRDKVIYAGVVPFSEHGQFNAMLDCFIGASLSEGFGFSHAQASRCGVPVVSANAGSLPEVVKNGKTGILVPPRDHKALAKATIKVLTNPKLARRLGKNGARYTKRFTWERSVETHLKLYNKMLR
jgi:glycosyltransferase involved in cell wall biosynthesis